MLRRRSFLLAAKAPPWRLARNAGQTTASFGDKLKFTFHHDPQRDDKPYLFPLMTPAGRTLSRVPGDATDHPWHRGLFYGHGLVSNHDFWREQGREKTGTLQLTGVPVAKVERNAAHLGGRFLLLPPDQRPLGTVTQHYRLAAPQANALQIHFTVTLHASHGQPLALGDTDDGGFAMRLTDAFRQDKGARLRNSENLETTEKIWGQPARWVHYSTPDAGVLMLDHPANLRHPGRWHARGYGLCSANPFALRSFTKDKTADGKHVIPAGGQLTLRYAVLLHDGPLTDEAIEAARLNFAKH